MHFAESQRQLDEDTKSLFLLIAPSERVESRLCKCLDTAALSDAKLSPYALHALLVSDSLTGWMDYMAWLESQLKEQVSCNYLTLSCGSNVSYSHVLCPRQSLTFIFIQSNRMVFATVDEKQQNSSRLIDLTISVSDRQALKLLENYVTELQIILPTLLGAIVTLRDESHSFCETMCLRERGRCRCGSILLQFDEHIKDLELCVQRVATLKEEAKSTAQLVSLHLCNIDEEVRTYIGIALRLTKLRKYCCSEKYCSRVIRGEQVDDPAYSKFKS